MQLQQRPTTPITNTSIEDGGETRLRNHKLSLTCVCIDSQDRYAFTGSKDGSIIKWCLETKKILGKINPVSKQRYQLDRSLQQKNHTRHINCLAISSDDKFLVSGGWDKKIRIWSPSDLSWIHTFTLHKQEITALAFRQGHPTLYSGSADRSVMLWTLEDDDNRCYVESLYGHESPITSLDVLKKEKVLSSGGRDQSIRVWKIVEQAQTVFQSKHESVDVAKYIDDKTFVTGGEDGAISIWTTMKRSFVCTLANAHSPTRAADKGIKDFNIQKDSSCWISALATFPFNTPKQLSKPTKKQKLDDLNGERFVTGYDDNDERGNDDNEQSSDEEPGEGGGSESKQQQVVALIASGSCNTEILIWKLIKSGGKYELERHKSLDCHGFINDLRFTSDGKKLVAACGQEHKSGRWWKLKGTKNCMKVFDV